MCPVHSGEKKTVSTLSILSYCTGELNVDIPLVPCKDLFTIGGLNEGMCLIFHQPDFDSLPSPRSYWHQFIFTLTFGAEPCTY